MSEGEACRWGSWGWRGEQVGEGGRGGEEGTTPGSLWGVLPGLVGPNGHCGWISKLGVMKGGSPDIQKVRIASEFWVSLPISPQPSIRPRPQGLLSFNDLTPQAYM